MAGIEDVAFHAGVSTATVSRALSGRGPVSEKTRLKVEASAAALGYVVSSNASSLASGRTRNIGVLVPFLGRWFFTSVLAGVQQTLIRRGYDLTLYNLEGEEGERDSVFQHFLLRQRFDAVIAVSLELSAPELDRLHSLGKPIVGLGGPLPGVNTLTVDDVEVAKLATGHLLSLGHTRIAHIGGGEEFDVDFHLPASRRTGYEEALESAGVSVDPALFQPGDFTIEGGYRAAKQLLGNPFARPTAIFAASDEMAIGAILAARDLGLNVPTDISIVGIDGHELSDFFGLTTVTQFADQQGERAVEVLLTMLDPTKEQLQPANTSLPFELLVRSSTARPHADPLVSP